MLLLALLLCSALPVRTSSRLVVPLLVALRGVVVLVSELPFCFAAAVVSDMVVALPTWFPCGCGSRVPPGMVRTGTLVALVCGLLVPPVVLVAVLCHRIAAVFGCWRSLRVLDVVLCVTVALLAAAAFVVVVVPRSSPRLRFVVGGPPPTGAGTGSERSARLLVSGRCSTQR